MENSTVEQYGWWVQSQSLITRYQIGNGTVEHFMLCEASKLKATLFMENKVVTKKPLGLTDEPA